MNVKMWVSEAGVNSRVYSLLPSPSAELTHFLSVMVVVNVQCIARAALSGMESGEAGNEHYDVTRFAHTFQRVMLTNGHTQISICDYVRILHAMMQQCCQHGDETPCNLCRCNYHVREHLETVLESLRAMDPTLHQASFTLC